jgi:pilus assembly protein Flp/PilA
MVQLLNLVQAWLAAKHSDDDERGATMVEYGLLVAFIAVVVLAGATLLGTNLNSVFSSAANAI